MSNATDKLAIANKALLSLGKPRIATLAVTDVDAAPITSIFEGVVKELLEDDWSFNRKRVLLSDLTQLNKLMVDKAPSAAVWKAGATITGASSGVTCTVKERLSDTVYLVTEPSGDFKLGEVLSDGTNSVDTVFASGCPNVYETLALGQWDYGYVMPTDKLRFRHIGDQDFDGIKYPHNIEGQLLYTNYTTAWLHYNRWLGEDEDADTSDVTLMPFWFHRLISARIAYIMSENATQNQRIRPKVEVEWHMAYLNAKERNGDETYYRRSQDDWVKSVDNELFYT